ncbi:hypothetical protein BJ546DRAFT_839123, partial [Cryomyces antarcticus]
VRESSVINVSDLTENKEELKLFPPLGCGFQTGMGTVDLFAGAGKGNSVMIIGLGSVGLAAIAAYSSLFPTPALIDDLTFLQAAKNDGAHTIIGVDRFPAPLGVARELGATHPGLDLSATIESFTDGIGSTITVNTTGSIGLISARMEMTGPRGQMIILRVAPADAELSINLVSFLQFGKSFRGNIEGDVTLSTYIPKIIVWYRKGQFPLGKLIKFYPVKEFETALSNIKSGATVKPVLV